MNLNNAKTARIIMIISIVLSILIGNYRSVSSETQEVIEVFEIGEDKDGLSARNDIKDRYNDAMNLLSIASRNGISDDSINMLSSITEKILFLLDSKTTPNTIKELNKLNNELTNAFDTAYSIIIEKTNSSDDKLALGLYDDFHSSANILSHSDYNQAAVEYNQMIDSFPNSFLSITNQAQPLSLFGE